MLIVLFVILSSTIYGSHSFMPFKTLANQSSLIGCLRRVMDSFVANSTVVFFLDEIQHLPWTDSLLKVMRKPKYIIHQRYADSIYGFYVLFPEPDSGYRQHFHKRIHSRSKFLLVWPRHVNETIVASVFEDFWYHHYINVVAMVVNATSFNFYTFDPYSVAHCNAVGRPYVITEWNSKTRQFTRNDSWFPRKLRNFAGCPLKAIGNHQPPDNIMYFNGTWSVDGVGSEILRVTREYANFTPIIVGAEINVSLNLMWYNFAREIAYISQAVRRGEADFAFGWFSYAIMETSGVDATMELGRVSSIDCFGWAVPYRAGNKPPYSTYYVNEFKIISWSLIAIVLAVCALLFHLAWHRGFALSALAALQTFLEQPVSAPRADGQTASFNVLFTSFCFYSLVVSAAYKASFSSFLSVPNQGREFKSVKDILSSSLQICGSPEMLKVMNDSAGHTSMGRAVLRRYKVLEPCDYTQIMTRLVRERDLALLSVKRKMYYYSLHEAKRIKVKIPFRLIPGCLVRPHTTHFMFKRGSHLIEPFNAVLNRLFESGITTYWILHLGTNRMLPLERLKGRTLKLVFLNTPLMMLLAGYVLGGIVLIGEIVVHWRCKRRTSCSIGRKNL